MSRVATEGVVILSPTFIAFLGVADHGAAADAGSLLLRAPALVGEALAVPAGHGVVVAGAGAARRGKAVLRRVGEGANFACDYVMERHSRNVSPFDAPEIFLHNSTTNLLSASNAVLIHATMELRHRPEEKHCLSVVLASASFGRTEI